MEKKNHKKHPIFTTKKLKMKAIALCTFAYLLSINIVTAQRDDLKALIGTTWVATDGSLGTLIFKNEKTLGGYDGCNNYGSQYSFEVGKGFILEDITATERLCTDVKTFSPHFLGSTASFRVRRKGKEVIFYDKDKKTRLKMRKQFITSE